MDIVVSGSSGFIGTRLRRALEDSGHTTIGLTRSPSKPDEVGWDLDAGTIDAEGLEGVHAVVHLAGENIGKRRWNAEHKARVLSSRIRGTRLLTETLAGLQRPPSVLVSASGVDYYGSHGDEELTEDSPPGTGFLATVCREWEAATAPAAEADIRVATIRSAIVLGRGGILPRILFPFRIGLGGKLGSGRQYWSWITIDDELRAISFLIEREDLSGPFNLSSPNPVTNAEFTDVLGRVLKRPTVFTAPAPVLKVALGAEMANSLLLEGQRVVPARLQGAGFEFRDPHLEPALRRILDG